MSDEGATDALTWLAFALGDLEAARARPGHPQRPRIVAFHAHQAVEKALKAALVLSDVDPPRTHDLDALRNLLPAGWRVSRRHRDLAPVVAIQAATAVRQAVAIVRSVREDFERRGITTADLAPA